MIDTRKFSVYLRGFKEDDYKQINKWRNDPHIQQLVSTSFKYVSEAIELEWVKQKMMDNRKDIYLAICLKDDNKMIGYTSLNNIDYINRSVHGGGIVIDKEFQNGLERYEVGILMRELAFDHLNLNRYTASCIAEHIVSRITLEAMGFQLEGYLRQSVYKDGKYHDQYIFSLLREDYYRMVNNGEYTLSSYLKKIKQLKKTIK